MGYYWPKMMTEAIAYAKKCHVCQIHGDFVHQLPEQLHPTDSTWPFEMWGMDIMGPISPPSAKGHRFILAVTDYFSKWVEAISLREVKTSDVIQFIKHHVIYRFGVPRRIVHDNGPQFVSYSFQHFCIKFKIQSISSTAYYPPANGLAEAFNKTIGKLLKKFVSVPNATGTRNSESAFGRTALQYEPRQRLHLSLWSMEQRLISPWKF